jgi:hypothetical protein
MSNPTQRLFSQIFANIAALAGEDLNDADLAELAEGDVSLLSFSFSADQRAEIAALLIAQARWHLAREAAAVGAAIDSVMPTERTIRGCCDE